MNCKYCAKELDEDALIKNKYICSHCGKYHRIPAKDRIRMIADRDSFSELFDDVCMKSSNASDDYLEKLCAIKEKTELDEAVITGTAKVFGEKIVLAVCDSSFMMGSMGYVVGEKITKAIEYAIDSELPVFIFCCSGGARMQEGLISLMQMEKTAAAIARLSEAGIFYSTILTDPTTGGVTASFAMLGDIIMAEKDAIIGFTGERVIRQTIGKELPDGFQSAEFQCEHGMVDGIVERNRLRKMIQFFAITNKKKDKFSVAFSKTYEKFVQEELDFNDSFRKISAWDKVKMNRKSSIYQPLDFVKEIFDIFVELKGDRLFGDDSAIAGGISIINGTPVTVIATRRGKTSEEIVKNNFGMPSPEGYRKSLRLMKQAEKFNRPIIILINTPGAYPGQEAEERGQGEAIARNLYEMSRISVPILTVIVGEAGSGGALALAVANEVWMLETATYSILSPEGYASILWRDSSRAADAAEKMNITAKALKEGGMIDKIIPIEKDDSFYEMKRTSLILKSEITSFLHDMSMLSKKEIVEQRERRFRRL